jgi:hypothetical protein
VEMSSSFSFLRRDGRENLPIHWATNHSKDVEVLRYLAEKHSSSLGKRGYNDMSPLQCLVARDYFDTQLSMVHCLSQEEDKTHTVSTVVDSGVGRTTPLHTFCLRDGIREESMPLFHELPRRFPDAVKSRDQYGALPLHYAVSSEGCWVAGVVDELLRLYSEDASVVDNRGWLSIIEDGGGLNGWRPYSKETITLRFLLRHHCPTTIVNKYALQCDAFLEDTGEHDYSWSDIVRRLLLRADPTACPAQLRELNYAERRMAMFLIFSAFSKDPPEVSFVRRLR